MLVPYTRATASLMMHMLPGFCVFYSVDVVKINAFVMNHVFNVLIDTMGMVKTENKQN